MNENLPIDPAQLDEEWLQQPLLFDEAQEHAADCLDTRDILKLELSELEGDRALYLREKFVEEGFAKPPAQGVVDDWVAKRGEVKLLKKDLHTAQIAFVKVGNMVESFQMRKRALEKLTDLHISNYFSVPNPNHLLDGGKRIIEAKKKKVEEGSKKATEALNDKKKTRTKVDPADVKKKLTLEDVRKKLTLEAQEVFQEALDKENEKKETPVRKRRRR